ncbi:MAG TPA: family 1 glycosylhydrolase [Candidatus Saccharimonadales bacterium]|nr:family 1 glycosylhydrolase [Candidatus Saccharimonadales bacterium]
MQKKSQPEFPKKFLWGAATSAHQVEGDTHNQWTIWELENAKSKAAQAKFQWGDLANWPQIEVHATDPDNYVSGKGTAHYKLFRKDFDLLEQMNMNALRFGIEWSRVEPNEGAWSVEAITYYRNYIQELKSRGIEPVLTLFHFTLPVWFAEKGGFARRKNIRYFVRFAEKIMHELGQDITYIITINEPDTYVYEGYYQGDWPPNLIAKKWLFLRVLNNLARAHNQTARMIHALNKRYKVSVAKNSIYFYPGDDAWLSRASTAIFQYLQDDYFLKKIIKNSDFIGVNFYFSNRVYGYRVHNPDERLSDLGWDLSPDHLQFALERLHDKYRKPIIITENGLADSEDIHRRWWLTKTIIAMQNAIAGGVKLEGYLHWSLLDNFEWDKGKWPRFGLIAVNYDTYERTLRPSAEWFGKVIKRLREK